MKRLLILSAVMLSFALSVGAQEIRHELTVQGSGFFPKETSDSGLTSSPTNSGGVMAGYRFHVNRWLALEGDYDYFRNSDKFSSTGSTTRISSNVHAVTGSAVVKLPVIRKFKPFVVAGGGAMVFDPRNVKADRQTKGAFMYGGGADLPVMKHVALRTEYRGFVYKSADYGVNSFKVDKVTHSAVPSAGIVLTF